MAWEWRPNEKNLPQFGTRPGAFQSSPIVIDTHKDGIRLGPAGRTVSFDVNADGSADTVQWVRPRGDEAFLSPHVGDLASAATCEALAESVEHLLAILEVTPQAVAHDLHPDFHSSRFAVELAHARGIPAIGVQHHHAHIAAVAAEHRFEGPLVGLALDGVGLGTDGAPWGGELLRVDGPRFSRIAHLGALRLPGGDRRAAEPRPLGRRQRPDAEVRGGATLASGLTREAGPRSG